MGGKLQPPWHHEGTPGNRIFRPIVEATTGNLPVQAATANGHTLIACILLGHLDAAEATAQVNAIDSNDRTLLHLAASQGDPRLVQLALDRGAKVDLEDKFKHTAMAYALQARPLSWPLTPTHTHT